MNLTKMLIYPKDNNKSFETICFVFKRKIDFLAMSFGIESYKNDILLFLWKLTKKINISDFESENAIYSYICISLKNYCINLYHKDRKNSMFIYNSILTNIEIDKNFSYNSNHNSSLFFDELILGLSDSQKKVITMRYKYCLSDYEIASYLSISRQAVYKNRIAALNKLHKHLCA